MFFDGIAFAWLFYTPDGRLVDGGSGSLFDLPATAKSPPLMEFYSTLRAEGWRTCPLGYAVFTKKISSVETSLSIDGYLVIPGLKVKGVSKISGKSEGLTIFTEQRNVERHVEKIIIAERRMLDRFDQLTRQNIHEVRGLNGGIYHAAEELRGAIPDEPKLRRVADLAGNIVALSQILAARLDFINYLTDESFTEADFGNVPVYKKFDKMTRCFTAKAAKNNVSISIRGTSFGCAFGPTNMFDLVAYLLLDNALKYSPRGERIDVHVSDGNHVVNVVVSSVGPRLEKGEEVKIFDQDYRGEMARKSGKGGSGIGLCVLRRLVTESYGGAIDVLCGKHKVDIDNIPYGEISFGLVFPRFE